MTAKQEAPHTCSKSPQPKGGDYVKPLQHDLSLILDACLGLLASR